MRYIAIFGLAMCACSPQVGRAGAVSTPNSDDDDPPLGTSDGGVVSGDCPEGSELVYVVDLDGTLSSFSPTTLTFKDIGMLSCPAQFDATPFSMAVDRTAVAWVLYSSGEVFNVDTSTAKCQTTKFPVDQQGFAVFGMGFAADGSGAKTETLYIGGGDGNGLSDDATLASINPQTLLAKRIKKLNGWPELTGTGDGKLWGFFPNSDQPRVASLDHSTGVEGQTFALDGLDTGGSWAFAHWGGDFWLFLGGGANGNTQVHHLQSSDGTLTTPIPFTNRTIVGAGVSTCAPTVIP